MGLICKKLNRFFKGAPFRGLIALAAALVLLMLSAYLPSPVTYGADSDEIEDELEQAQEDAQDLEDQIDSLNDQLSALSNEIEELNTRIAEKEAEIASLEAEIEAAQDEITSLEEDAGAQYESLTAWIQVSYENDFDSLFLSIMSADSFSEVLTQAEYVQSLSDFGIDLIKRYNETIDELTERKAELESQYTMLTQTLDSLSELEEEENERLDEISDLILTATETLDDKNEEIVSLEEELAAQLEYEAELEAQKEAEEAAKAAELAAQEAENTAEAVVSTSTSDLALLAALIYCEAGGESYEGKLAVGCVVMNRVRSSSYPNTVSGVIYQSGQFSPAASGRLATVLSNGLATESCYEAASYVLAGNLPYPDFLSFCSASVSLGISTTVIGNHQFY